MQISKLKADLAYQYTLDMQAEKSSFTSSLVAGQDKFGVLQRNFDILQEKYDVLFNKDSVLQGKHDILQGKHDILQGKHDILQATFNVVQGQCDNLSRKETYLLSQIDELQQNIRNVRIFFIVSGILLLPRKLKSHIPFT